MHKAIELIKQYFGCTLQEIKSLTALDRQELASAIAREKGIAPESCAFELINY